MFGAMTSLTGGGGMSASSSATAGGDDTTGSEISTGYISVGDFNLNQKQRGFADLDGSQIVQGIAIVGAVVVGLGAMKGVRKVLKK